ncbi:MAG TPA: YfbU family protein [Clostridia bacterium]|nr:YfbU family protein [Clostridia bacterium]
MEKGVFRVDLSGKERLLLYNQYEILKLLSKGDAEQVKSYEMSQKIVKYGYKHEYYELADWMFDELPDEDAKFVWDVFQMFDVLGTSFDNLPDEQKGTIDPYKIKFHGYDGNEEGSYLFYATFVLRDMERYQWLWDEKKSLNSHCRMLGCYGRKLAKWKEIRDGEFSVLSYDQIMEIAEV